MGKTKKPWKVRWGPQLAQTSAGPFRDKRDKRKKNKLLREIEEQLGR